MKMIAVNMKKNLSLKTFNLLLPMEWLDKILRAVEQT